MSKGFIITIVILFVLIFIPVIPFKSLDVYERYKAGSGDVACYPKTYSIYGLIQLYNEKVGTIFSPGGGQYHVTWHFLSCYNSNNSYGVVQDKDWPMPN
jgi:hypothetical protein